MVADILRAIALASIFVIPAIGFVILARRANRETNREADDYMIDTGVDRD